MKLATYGFAGHVKIGAIREAGGAAEVIDLGDLGYSRMEELIADGDAALAEATRIVAKNLPEAELAAVKPLAPLSAPPRIFCIGLNYLDHDAESKMVVQAEPTVFLKLQSSLTGPGAPIVLPRRSNEPDYEAELTVVVGKGGYANGDDREEHIFGYRILNDVSAQDIQLATTQWTLGKSVATFCPVGPWIVTRDEISDPHALEISLSIDGEQLQHSNTRDLLFKVPALLQYISGIVALETGDIISTGRPPGVGLGRTPKRWLKPSEKVAITIQGIGTLTNYTVAECA